VLTKSQIQAFPKVELHCHLDGSIRPETLLKIANQQKLPIVQDLSVIEKQMQAPKDCANLEEYLERFDFVLPYLQSEFALEEAAFDVMEQAFEDGIAYIEIRFAPSQSMTQLSCSQTIQAVVKGIARAEAIYPIKGNLLIIGMRQDATEAITQIFTDAILEEKVVGLDLAGPEEDDYVPKLESTYQLLVDGQKVQLTLHAGECGCLRNVYQAIESGAQRIGHGIILKGDSTAQELVAQKNVCIEGCPTSNIQTKAVPDYQEYPFREWLATGVPFCLNTDNRTVSNTTLTNEYVQMADHCQMSAHELRLLNETAARFSFATDKEKEQLIQMIQNWEII
jgi:adenosine deaminase